MKGRAGLPWLGAACIGMALMATSVTNAQGTVKPLEQWSGSVEVESLESIAPPAITTAEGLGILWRAWQAKGDPPKINFDEAIVVSATTKGSKLSMSTTLEPNGNLQVHGLASRDLRPGFRYVMASIPRAGIVTVNGKPLLPTIEPIVEPTQAPTAKKYEPTENLAGSIKIVGSTTMAQVLAFWAEDFNKSQPKITIELDCQGSETGMIQLGKDSNTVIAYGRPIGEKERKSLEEKIGQKVFVFPVCEDDIAVIVHPTNPVQSLTRDQLKMIYAPSSEPLTWGKLGVTGQWSNIVVKLHARDEKSGTRHYLRQLAVGEGGAERSSRVHTSFGDIVESVANDLAGIGYCRIHSLTDKVRSVPIGPSPTGELRQYLRRTCYLVATGTDKPAPVVRELLHFIYRLDGQSQLFRDGFLPLEKDIIDTQLDRIGVEEFK